MPAGYLLDNPFLQRLIVDHTGNDQESRCFRELVRDLLRISPNESPKTNTLNDWNEMLENWVTGTGSRRSATVYLNCLQHNRAVEVQRSRDPHEFIQKMAQGLQDEWRVDLQEFLSAADDLKLRIVLRGDFDFDSLMRERLLTGAERFGELSNQTRDKLQAIAEAVARRPDGKRLSRSLLSNQQLCMDLDVKESMTLNRHEYDQVAPLLGHYHHYAFAKSLGLEGFATRMLPQPDQLAKRLLRNQLERITDAVARPSPQVAVRWPLEEIRYSDIWRVRIGSRVTFREHLNDIYDATKSPDVERYRESLHSFARFTQQKLSFAFSPINPEHLADGLEGSMFAPSTSGKALVYAAKYSYAFFRDFFPNIRKELQLRWLFRKLVNPISSKG